MFAFVGIIVLLMYWYSSMFNRGSDTSVLNEAILTGAVSEVDQASRIYEGVLLLSNTFEPVVWETIKVSYPEGSKVQFDYMFDTTDDRFVNIGTGPVSSPTYRIGGTAVGDAPRGSHVTYMVGRPVENVRVKVAVPGDNVGEWTYIATVAVDSASNGN